jgi:hypothetical protein
MELTIIENIKIISKYEKNKKNIMKWRDTHKDEYLLNLHKYNKTMYEDPIKREAKIKKIKEYQQNKKLLEAEQRKINNEPIKKRGRPSKYL